MIVWNDPDWKVYLTLLIQGIDGDDTAFCAVADWMRENTNMPEKTILHTVKYCMEERTRTWSLRTMRSALQFRLDYLKRMEQGEDSD